MQQVFFPFSTSVIFDLRGWPPQILYFTFVLDVTSSPLFLLTGQSPNPLRDPLPPAVRAGAGLSPTRVQLPHGFSTQ